MSFVIFVLSVPNDIFASPDNDNPVLVNSLFTPPSFVTKAIDLTPSLSIVTKLSAPVLFFIEIFSLVIVVLYSLPSFDKFISGALMGLLTFSESVSDE